MLNIFVAPEIVRRIITVSSKESTPRNSESRCFKYLQLKKSLVKDFAKASDERRRAAVEVDRY